MKDGWVGRLPGRLEGVVQILHVLVVALGLPPAQPLHVPAIGLEALRHILGFGDVGVVLDGDVVVVVQHDQVPELLVAGQRRRLVADPFLHVPVRDEAVDEVVERAGTGLGAGVEQAALPPGGHGHADRVAETLSERARRGLDAGGVVVLGMAGGLASPRPVMLKVVQGQPVPGQVELDVQGQAGMAAGQYEPVPARPERIGRIVPEELLIQQVGSGREAHRRARVTRARPLHRVHRQDADKVHRPGISLRPVKRSLRAVAHAASSPSRRRLRYGNDPISGGHDYPGRRWLTVRAGSGSLRALTPGPRGTRRWRRSPDRDGSGSRHAGRRRRSPAIPVRPGRPARPRRAPSGSPRRRCRG